MPAVDRIAFNVGTLGMHRRCYTATVSCEQTSRLNIHCKRMPMELSARPLHPQNSCINLNARGIDTLQCSCNCRNVWYGMHEKRVGLVSRELPPSKSGYIWL